jgi:hypothetical protein
MLTAGGKLGLFKKEGDRLTEKAKVSFIDFELKEKEIGETINGEEITILGAIVEAKKSESLARFFWSFERIDLKPLSDKDIKQLVMFAIRDYNIQFADKSAMKLFMGKVISNSCGIPLAALQLCRKASNHTRKVSINFIREHLRDHGASVKFIDATYLFIGLFGVIMAMRYISRGMGSMDAYTFWGAMSGILLVVRLLMFRSMRKRG